MQDIFRNVLSQYMSYCDIITCTRVCQKWYHTFKPCLKILHEWYAEKTPQRFSDDALAADDIHLVDFAINVLKIQYIHGQWIKSQRMYDHIKDLPMSDHYRVKFGDYQTTF